MRLERMPAAIRVDDVRLERAAVPGAPGPALPLRVASVVNELAVPWSWP